MAAAAETPGSSASPHQERLLQSLSARGWCFRDPSNEIIQELLHASPSPSPEAVETELVDVDLRLFGGKSLPDRAAAAATGRRLSYLHGPIVLQVVSVRDIYRSIIDASFKNPQQHRLLRFVLTDGISEAVAIEFFPIPFIIEDIAPGTKICLENKIPIHNGILCLSAKNISIMGGVVQSLYEEWQMNQKFSGLSRPSLRLSQNDDGVGPPPFEKLNVEARPSRTSRSQTYSDNKARKPEVGCQNVSVSSSGKPVNESSSDENKESAVEPKQSISDGRPKEVSEAIPVQNQAAAQKLLQKMTQAAPEDRYGRGHRFKGKGRQEDTPVFTLDEWEKRKSAGLKSTAQSYIDDTSRDEELARQLQEQLDLEDSYGVPESSDADPSAVLKKREAGEEIFEGEDGGEEGAEDEGEAGEDFSPIQTSNGSGNSSCGRPSHNII
uniref:RecQ mediated genome instability protein 1 OB-fold domain-containing protein n=1 Tax=Oryza rufipogon TaxID=4529 RepID=A0A0E0MS50_ORYRU